MSRQGIFSRTQHSLYVKMLSVLAVFLMMWMSVEPAVAALQEEEIPYNLEQRLEQIRHEVDWEFRNQTGSASGGLLKQILQRNRQNNPLSRRFSPARNGFPFANQQSASSQTIRPTIPGRFSTTPGNSLLSSQNSSLSTDPLAQLPAYARENLSDDSVSPPQAKPTKLLAQANTAIVSDAVSGSAASESSTQTDVLTDGSVDESIETPPATVEQDSESSTDANYMLLAQSCYDKYPVGHGSSRQALFIDAYNRVGGKSHLGCTNTATFWWRGIVRQDFRGSTSVGDAAILHDEARDNPKNSVPAYPIVGGIWQKYWRIGGPESSLGVPTSREGYSTTYSSRYLRQYFANGYIAYDMGVPYSERPTIHYWPAKDSSKWRAEYHNGYNLNAGATYIRNETSLDYDWGNNPPGGLCWANHSCWGLWKDNFSARWTKREYFTEGVYRFLVGADDGIRMWVDGKLIFNEWRDQGYTEFTRSITLTEGYHDLKVEYYEKASAARIKVKYERLNQYNLNVIKEGTGVGGVVASGITCGTDCSEYYDDGTQIALAAIPDTGSTFVGWEVKTWEREGGTLGNISMLVFNNALYQAVRGTDDGLYTRWTTDGENWTGWYKDRQTSSTLINMAVFNGRLYQALRGTDNGIYTRSTADVKTWTSWEKNGSTHGDVTMMVFNNRLYQAVRGTNDGIYTRYTTDGQAWTSWVNSGSTKGNVSMVVFNNALYQAVRGTDDGLYTRWTTDGETWTGWYKDRQTSGTSINMAVFNGRLYQALRGTDNGIYTRSTADVKTWTSWEQSGSTHSDVTMMVFNNRLYQAVRGSNNEILTRFSSDGQTWTDWQEDGTTAGEVMMAVFNNRLYQAIRNLDNGIYTRSSADGQNWTIRESANSQCSGTGDCILTMDSAKNVKARFARNGLVAHWKFDDNERDSSGSDHHGTPSEALQYVEGKLGNAAVFNGSSHYVTTRDSEKWLSFGGTQAFSIEGWVKPRSGGSGGTVISKFNGNVKGEYYLSISPDGKVIFHREVSPWNLISTKAIPFDEFSHVVLTYDGTDMKIYINGELDSTQTGGAQGTDTITKVLIGAQFTSGAAAKFFDGSLDNVKLYNRALTPEEVEYFYTPDTSGLIAAWPLNESTEDIGPNRLNGTAVGGLDYIDGAVEKAATLNGTDAYIEFGNAPYTDFRGDEEFTVSMWVTGDSRGIAMGRMRYYFRFTDTDIQFIFKQSLLDGDPYMMTIPYPDNWNADDWNCVTFVYGDDDARRKIYVNGVLVGEKDHLPMQSLHPLSTLKIGKSDYAGGMYFSGNIDDVRIYDHALPATECNCSGDVRPYPLSDEERERLSNLGIHECMPGSGDPVNSVTGNPLQQSKDLDIPGLGNLDFTLIRTNNGHDSRDGLFGVGWTTFLDMYLRIANDDSIDVRYPDGSGKYYIWDGSEYLPGQDAMFDTLIRTATGYALSRPDQTTYLFDEEGHLTTIRNRFGHEIVLLRDAQGALTKVIDTVGREILVTQEGRHITSISDPAGRTLRYAYDSKGNLTHFTDANGGVRVYEYVNHRMTAITEPEGNRYLQNVYDSEGRVIKQIDAAGNVSSWDYNTPNETLFTNNLGQTTRYVFNERSQVTLIEDALGYTEHSVYNADDLLVSFTDKRGNTRTSTYDSRGNMLSATDLGGATTTYTYTDTNDLSSVTNALGATTHYIWDNGKLVRIEFPDGSSNTFTYNQYGQMLTFTDAEGHTTTHSYNAEGLLDTVTNPLGGTTRYGYDSIGRQISMTDANGDTSYFEYDGNDNVTRIIFPDGSSMAMEYDGNNNIAQKTDRRGGVTSYQLDGNMKLVAETDAEGNTSHYEYDAMYRRVKATDPLGNVMLYRYDALDRLVEIEDALGGIVTFEHDGNGNIVSMTGPMGNQSRFEFDAMNQLLRQVDVLGNATAFSYDALGQLLDTTQPNGANTHYTYDVMGRLVEIRDPLGQTWKMAHDAAGRTISVTDPLGQVSRSEFDANGNQIKRSSPNGAVTLFAYDAVGNRTEVTDALGRVTSYAYDTQGSLISMTSPSGAVVTMTYDEEGALTAITDANGNSSSFVYNKLGLPVKESDFAGNATEYEYDAARNLITLRQANGASWKYEYDELNRRVRETDPLGSSSAFSYNSLNQLIALTDALGHVTRFEYDALDRLLKEIDPKGNVWESEYDKAGRVVMQKDPRGGVLRYSYDLKDQLTEIQDALGGKQSFSYDALGHVISSTDAAGRTVTMSYDEVGALQEERDALGYATRYSYDLAGNRLTQTDALGRETRYAYDDDNNVTTVSDPRGGTMTFTYDNNGNVIAMTDANGHTAAFTYDANGLLLSETLPGGQSTKYAYDAMRNLTSYVNTQGSSWNYSYDALNRLVKENGPLGSGTTYQYDKLGRMVQETDALGGTTRHEYDAVSCLTKTTDPVDGVWEFRCDPAGNVVSQTNPRGAATTFSYDLLDRLTGVRDALGGEQNIQYDAVGNIVASTDAKGRTVKFAYDERDQVIEQHDAAGQATRFAYDKVGNLTSETDALGRVTRHEYNANNELTLTTDALGGKTRFAYDLVGNVAAITDARGYTTTLAYDADNLLVSQTMPGGQETRFEYDDGQNLVKRINGLGNAWSYAYDALGRFTGETDPLGNTIAYAYDALGNLTQKTDANGHAVQYAYDALSRLTEVRQPTGAITRYGYDMASNVTSITDANDHITSFSYDLLDRMIEEVNASGNTWKYEYDAVDNLVTRNANGLITNYSYTANDLPASIQHHDGSTVSFQYDAVSNQIGMTDRTGSTQNVYDDLNRLTSTSNPAGYKVKYEYDAAGNVTGLSYPDSRKLSYGYDVNGFVSRISDPDLNVFEIARDAAHQVTAIANPNGTRVEYNWDAAERLTGVRHLQGGDIISAFAYTLDPAGNRIKAEEEFSWRNPRQLTHSYTYDALNRLTRSEDNEGNFTEYTFDAVGNRTSHTSNIARPVAERSRTTYSYGPENRLTGVKNFVDDGAGNWTLRDETALSYDGLNRAVRRTHTQNGKHSSIDTVYNGLDPIAEYVNSDSGAYHVNYYRGMETPLSLTQVDEQGQSASYYFHLDGLDSVSALTDQQGKLAHGYGYRDYGTMLDEFGSIAEADSFSHPHNRLGYTGQEWNQPNGLSHFFAREYDPSVGVWLQQDVYRGEFDDPASLHRYAYVSGNPMSYIDEYGYWSIKGGLKKIGGGIKKGYNKAKDLGNKYVVQPVKKYVVQPINKYVVQPVYNKVIKPVYNKVIKPIYNKVIKPIYNKVIKPIYNKVIKPIYNKVIKPVITKAQQIKQQVTQRVQQEIKKLPQKYQQALKTGKQIVTGDAMKMVTSSIKQVWNDPVGTVMSAAEKADEFVNWVEDKGKFIAENGIKRCQLFVDSAVNLGKTGLQKVGEFFEAHPRIAGGLQLIGGIAETAAGIGFAVFTAETGVGIAAGIAVALHGLDQTQAGIRTLVSGQTTDTLTSTALQKAGVPRPYANLIDAGISIVGTVGLGIATKISQAGKISQVAKAGASGTDDALKAAANSGDEVSGLLDDADDLASAAGKASKSPLGQLKKVGTNTWESSNGLRYGPDPRFGNRVQHILRHSVDDVARSGKHGVFSAGKEGTLGVVDEAWSIAKQGGSNVQVVPQGARTQYIVDMGKNIGYVGGQEGAILGNPGTQKVMIIVENGNEVVTAFPVQ